MSRIKKISIALLSLAIILGITFNAYLQIEWGRTEALAEGSTLVPTAAYEYNFSGAKSIRESSTRENSQSADWWLRSGGELRQSKGIGRTLAGSLRTYDTLRLKYAQSAPVESDNGYHPQNVFRMLSQKKWKDFEQAVYVKVLGENLFNPENIHEWNAVSLLERYQNEDNYYYVGIRMDGQAVIKKKRNGTYSTLAVKPVFPGSYNRLSEPNIIPKNSKIGIKSKTYTSSNGSVTVEVYVDKNATGNWELAAQAVDGGTVGGSAITGEGYTGIYADFMELEFSNYKVWTLAPGSAAPAPAPAPTPEPDDEEPTGPSTDPDPVDTTPTTTPTTTPDEPSPEPEPEPAPQPSLSLYGLSTSLTLQEAGSLGDSSSPDWWVNSGAYLYVSGGIGKTVQGDLPSGDRWRTMYASANPTDTDNGLHPQNIFRLVTKSTFQDFVQQGYFKINEYNTSSSPNRAEHNGFLFFNRYKDGNNLYYTGIRVDGKAVIKKKVNGSYYTLASKPVYSGTYNRTSNPNLIPTGKWIGLRSVVADNSDGSVSIKVYMDKENNGNWTLVAEATDNGSQGAKVTAKASAGIRTDFMDVEFKQYSIKEN